MTGHRPPWPGSGVREQPYVMRRATILTAALAVLGTAGPLTLAPALGQPQTRPATTEPVVAAEDLTDPAILTRLLLDPASTTAQREFAAARLAADPRPEAINGLAAALSPSSAAPAQVAAAKALAAATPDDRLVEPLLALLTADGPANVKREVGRALGAYRENPDVRARLAELSISGPSATRRGAVAGLARL